MLRSVPRAPNSPPLYGAIFFCYNFTTTVGVTIAQLPPLPTGPQGATGPAGGPIGPTGVQGPTGPLGGPMGPTGGQGPTGYLTGTFNVLRYTITPPTIAAVNTLYPVLTYVKDTAMSSGGSGLTLSTTNGYFTNTSGNILILEITFTTGTSATTSLAMYTLTVYDDMNTVISTIPAPNATPITNTETVRLLPNYSFSISLGLTVTGTFVSPHIVILQLPSSSGGAKRVRLRPIRTRKLSLRVKKRSKKSVKSSKR